MTEPAGSQGISAMGIGLAPFIGLPRIAGVLFQEYNEPVDFFASVSPSLSALRNERVSASDHETQSTTRIAEWIVEARAGSEEALARILQFSRQYLLLIAGEEMPADLQAKAGASDLVQETHMEAAAAFAGFRGQTAAELLAWLRQILLHNLQDFTRRFTEAEKRRASREVPLDHPDSQQSRGYQVIGDESSPSNALRRREQDLALERAMAELPEDYRQVILWHHREDCSFEEIGRRLGRSEGAARKLWARAIQQLQDRMRVSDESN
jgi:RNA polymerase sigma-70 factor (ECF subfamily)